MEIVGVNPSAFPVCEISELEKLERAPQVSVLILAFNHEKTIARALDGILEQKCSFPIEIVVGEDCSTDQTLEILQRYQKAYPAIVRILRHASNVGMTRNFVTVAERCRGQFVAFCDGDDYWIDSDKLRLQLDALARHPMADISFHSCIAENAATGQLSRPTRRISCRERTISTRAVLLGAGSYMPTASIVVRSEILQMIPDWIAEQHGVVDVYVQAYGARRGGAVYLDRAMSVYRVEGEGAWTTQVVRDGERRLRFREARLRQLKAMMADFHGYEAVLTKLIINEHIDLLNSEHAALQRFGQNALRSVSGSASLWDKLRVEIAMNAIVGRLWFRIAQGSNLWQSRMRKILVAIGAL